MHHRIKSAISPLEGANITTLINTLSDAFVPALAAQAREACDRAWPAPVPTNASVDVINWSNTSTYPQAKLLGHLTHVLNKGLMGGGMFDANGLISLLTMRQSQHAGRLELHTPIRPIDADVQGIGKVR